MVVVGRDGGGGGGGKGRKLTKCKLRQTDINPYRQTYMN